MAAGFVAWAAWKLGRKVATDWLTILLWVVGATTPIFFHSAWAIPLAFSFWRIGWTIEKRELRQIKLPH